MDVAGARLAGCCRFAPSTGRLENVVGTGVAAVEAEFVGFVVGSVAVEIVVAASRSLPLPKIEENGHEHLVFVLNFPLEIDSK